MVEENNFVVFFYSNEIKKMLKIGFWWNTFLDWMWVSPELIFGYMVGVSSFWWWVEHLEACSGTTLSLGSAGPTIFSPGTRVPFVNIMHKNFVKGRYGRTSWFGRITKNFQNYFSMSCLLTNAMVKTNLKFKYAWCTKWKVEREIWYKYWFTSWWGLVV
jgi:hypothetical protein